MQNKGAIRLFAILLALACAYYLMFTWKAASIEGDAEAYAQNYIAQADVQEQAKKVSENPTEQKTYLDSVHVSKRNSYLDSLKKLPVYDLGMKK